MSPYEGCQVLIIGDLGFARLNEIHAVILAERLRWLSVFTKRRWHVAALNQSGIINPLVTKAEPPQEESARMHHLDVINSLKVA